MQYFLGLDAGGTNTYAVIVDEKGNVLGQGIGGNGNHQIDYNIARKSIHLAVNEALKNANVSKDDLSFSYLGIAGADRPIDYAVLTPMIEELKLPRFEIVGDTYIALRAGTKNPYGVVIICGTGVNCAGVSIDGKQYQCGGFNYLHGDFGGGSGLAVEVYRSVIRAWDGRGKKTKLTSLLLNYLNYESVEEMFHDFLDNKYNVPPDCAKLLFEAAEENDEVAIEILTYQGRELGLSARAVIERLDLNRKVFDVVLAGSILTKGKNKKLISQIQKEIEISAPNSRLIVLESEPVVGSLLLAMERSGITVSKEVYDKLHKIKEVKVG